MGSTRFRVVRFRWMILPSARRDTAVVNFFNAVYAWMAVGLAVTASVAWLVSTHHDLMKSVLSGGAMIGIFVAEIVLVLVISSAICRLNAAAATALFVLSPPSTAFCSPASFSSTR